MELEETLMLWKGESHIQGLFDQSPRSLHEQRRMMREWQPRDTDGSLCSALAISSPCVAPRARVHPRALRHTRTPVSLTDAQADRERGGQGNCRV